MNKEMQPFTYEQIRNAPCYLKDEMLNKYHAWLRKVRLSEKKEETNREQRIKRFKGELWDGSKRKLTICYIKISKGVIVYLNWVFNKEGEIKMLVGIR